MRILKKLFSGILWLALALLAVAFLLPSIYHVERSIIIDRPPAQVYVQVARLSNWSNWNPWSAMDPAAETSISGIEGQVGSSWSWDGDVLGKGSLTIVDMVPGRALRSKLVFEAPQYMEADDYWQFIPEGRATKVIWANEGHLTYPFGRYAGLFMDRMMGPDLEQGLHNLKSHLESRAM